MDLEIINNICKKIINTDANTTKEPIFINSDGITIPLDKRELKIILCDFKNSLTSDIKYKDTVKALDNYLKEMII